MYRRYNACDTQHGGEYVLSGGAGWPVGAWEGRQGVYRSPTGCPWMGNRRWHGRARRRGHHSRWNGLRPVSYTHLRAHETPEHLVCRLLLEKKKKKTIST